MAGTGAGGPYYQQQVPAQPVHPRYHAGYPAYPTRPDKSLAVAYALWFFLGFLGVHHFYLGKVGRGVGYLLTVGWFLVGWLIDLFTLPAQVTQVNAERRAGLR
ncbi:TM2 domain-containing protein [Isoptericola sp. b515]|uniref:TM2 domain-containing protein n=1 Tax=Isoptericola sp. b515 TaxID=3064652 RepID=UPI0027144861|nr:TM2 domain-containing protein [Isoptericola sp. b515]MDO8147501.1 TM2 domain-containing protein [Isoptericola sp. b515]